MEIFVQDTQVSRYQKKHSPSHTYPDHQPSFITPFQDNRQFQLINSFELPAVVNLVLQSRTNSVIHWI